MAFTHYISDNPFRLLNVGSSTIRAELSRKAKKAEMTAKANLPCEVGLAKLFRVDREDIERLPSVVTSLANDPKRRTIYRLLWPFEYKQPADANGTLADFDLLFPAASAAQAFHATQLRFLRCWLNPQADPGCVKLALDSFANLYNDAECDEYLVHLLQSEGESREQAAEHVRSAQDEVIDHLLTYACQIAVERWRTGDLSSSIAILQAVIASAFSEDEIDGALMGIAAAGDSELERLRSLTAQYEGWCPDHGGRDADDTEKLGQLARAVGERVPAAALWLEAVEIRVAQVACAMRDYAVALGNEKSDYEGAASILIQALSFPLEAAIRRKLEEDLAKAHELQAERQQWDNILPIDAPPALWTINGVGLTLYGRTPFAARPGWYLATQYFVVLFFPIFPIGRYLVSDASPRGWYFHGKAPLSRGHKYHLLVSLAVILVCFLLAAASNTEPPPANAIAGAAVPPTAATNPSPTSTTKVVQPVGPARASTHSKRSAKVHRAAAPRPQRPEPIQVAPIVDPLWPPTQAQDTTSRQRQKLLAKREALLRRISSEQAALSDEWVSIERARQNLRAESADVDRAQQQLRSGRARMDQAGQELSAEKSAFEQARGDLHKESEQIQSERNGLDHTSQSAVWAFNENVDRYNSDREQFNQKLDQYSTDRERFNQKAAAYDSDRDAFNLEADHYNRDQDDFNLRVRALNSRVRRGRRDAERLRLIEQALEQQGN